VYNFIKHLLGWDWMSLPKSIPKTYNFRYALEVPFI
jgi:hypothetical protein